MGPLGEGANGSFNDDRCLDTHLIEAPLLRSSDDSDQPTPSSDPQVSDSLKASHSDIVNFCSAQEKSSLFIFTSSNISLSPELSHRTDLKSCEQRSPSTESFKSTEGRSDDILSRSILKGLNTETKSDGCGNPENHVYISPSHLCGTLEIPRAISRIGSDASEEDISTNNCSLTLKAQLKQSHEETAISSVSDHYNVPLPSPIAHIEYSQSDPYFEPATIIRAHNPVCQVVFPRA